MLSSFWVALSVLCLLHAHAVNARREKKNKGQGDQGGQGQGDQGGQGGPGQGGPGQGGQGQSGVLCGRLPRICSSQAECIDGSCKCPDGTQGTGFLCCVPENHYLCEVVGDPHILAYEGAVGNLHWPCRYRLTRIVTPLDRGSEASHCSFEVFAINWISDKGRYYVKAVEIALAIGDFWQQVFTQHDVVKFDVGPDGFIDTENHLAPWGTPPDPFVWNLIQIQCSFDLDENIAILDVPQCDVKIKFRPYNPADEPGAQLRVPGISIEVGQNTGFGEVEEGRFGSSLCGETLVQGDDHKLYLDRAKLLFNTDKSVDQALLYEALRQGIEQKNLVPAAGQLIHNEGHCNESVRLFNNLCDSLLERIGAINACHRILKRKKTVRSLGSDNALKAFNLCLQAYCDCDADAWDQLKDMFNDIANRNIPHGVKNSVKKRCGNE